MSARNTHTHTFIHTHTHIYIYIHTHTQVQGMMTAEVNLPMLMSLLWMGLLPSGLALALETVIVHKLSRSCVLCVCVRVCVPFVWMCFCVKGRECVFVCVCVFMCINKYICIRVYRYIFLHVFTHSYSHVFLYMNTNTHGEMNAYVRL